MFPSRLVGYMLTRKGVVPDPAKIEALKKLPEPKTENLLQKFLWYSQLFVKV